VVVTNLAVINLPRMEEKQELSLALWHYVQGSMDNDKETSGPQVVDESQHSEKHLVLRRRPVGAHSAFAGVVFLGRSLGRFRPKPLPSCPITLLSASLVPPPPIFQLAEWFSLR